MALYECTGDKLKDVKLITLEFTNPSSAGCAANYKIAISKRAYSNDFGSDKFFAWEDILPNGLTWQDIIILDVYTLSISTWERNYTTYNKGITSFAGNDDCLSILCLTKEIPNYARLRIMYIEK